MNTARGSEDASTRNVDRHGRTIFRAVEQTPIEVPLADLIVDNRLLLYPEVQGHDYFRVNLSKDRLVLQAGGFVGLIPINDRVAIEVRPRVPIKNMERILSVAEHRPLSLAGHLRGHTSHWDVAPSLLDLFAQALLRSLDEIETQGIYREYIQHLEDTANPRGRILMRETLQKHEARGIYHRVTTARFEPAVDIAVNRCLKYAIWYLARHYASMRQLDGDARKILARLNRAYHLFDGADLDRSRDFFNDPLVMNPDNMPSVRSYYKQALNLAVTIIRNQGIAFDKSEGDVELGSLLIDMSKVFEVYLRSVLQSGLNSYAPSLVVLDGNRPEKYGGGKRKLFDSNSPHNTDATPDIVLRYGEFIDQYPLLIDVKYKAIESLPDRNDINQAIAYGVSYRARNVVLVHPRGSKARSRSGLNSLGTIGQLAFFEYTFDLAAASLVAEEDKFVSDIGRLALSHSNSM